MPEEIQLEEGDDDEDLYNLSFQLLEDSHELISLMERAEWFKIAPPWVRAVTWKKVHSGSISLICVEEEEYADEDAFYAWAMSLSDSDQEILSSLGDSWREFLLYIDGPEEDDYDTYCSEKENQWVWRREDTAYLLRKRKRSLKRAVKAILPILEADREEKMEDIYFPLFLPPIRSYNNLVMAAAKGGYYDDGYLCLMNGEPSLCLYLEKATTNEELISILEGGVERLSKEKDLDPNLKIEIDFYSYRRGEIPSHEAFSRHPYLNGSCSLDKKEEGEADDIESSPRTDLYPYRATRI